MVDELASATGDTDLAWSFDSAGALHRNFYENRMSHEWVERRLQRVADFVTRLERLLPEAE